MRDVSASPGHIGLSYASTSRLAARLSRTPSYGTGRTRIYQTIRDTWQTNKNLVRSRDPRKGWKAGSRPAQIRRYFDISCISQLTTGVHAGTPH